MINDLGKTDNRLVYEREKQTSKLRFASNSEKHLQSSAVVLEMSNSSRSTKETQQGQSEPLPTR